ncbi:MAG: nicotinamidase [Myxococcota bacterium]
MLLATVHSDALLVVDVQRDFCPGGTLAVPQGDAVVPVINRLAPHFGTVVMTQDWHPAGHVSFASAHPGRNPGEWRETPLGPLTLWPDHCVQGTKGARLHPGLEAARATMLLRKGERADVDALSCFRSDDGRHETGLAGYLRDRRVTHVWLTGLALDVCVSATALDAVAAGFVVTIVEDATRSIVHGESLVEVRARLSAAGVSWAMAGEA